MRLATVRLKDSIAVIAQEGSGEWRGLGFSNMLDVVSMSAEELKTGYERGRSMQGVEMRFLAPIPQPGKILAIGQNYMDHCREQNVEPPKQPLIFAKLISSVLEPNGAITWDPTLATAVDYEAELAVVIGKTTRNISEANALNAVFAYTCANDVTARDLQRGDGQWTRGKGLDTFCPLGPWLVTPNEIPDPQKLPIRCEVNGNMMQDSSTDQMIFGVSTIVAYMSRAFTLYPGDVLLTGTPAGVGFFRKPPVLLHDGDRVVVEIEGIGKLENTCREATAGA